jgi:SCP-2 sterol transfer family
MASLSQHPTVQAFQAKQANSAQQLSASPVDATWLRALCLEAGADDVGFVEIDDPAIADQRADILALFPPTKALISMVLRMNRENIRSPARSLANLEFHHADHKLEEVAREIVGTLEKQGVRALNPAVGFPMEMSQFPGKTWVVSHKPIAVAAGLGHMGIHRNVIHPRLGNHILLISGLPLVFQREQSTGLDATYHFTFTGPEEHKATIIIRNKTLQVQDGHIGTPNIRILVDSQTWLGILAKQQSIPWALVRRKLRIKGSPRLLQAFARCFPS